jgi:hypothetical protein
MLKKNERGIQMNVKQLLIDYKNYKEKLSQLGEKYVVMIEYEQKERAKELEREINILSQKMNYIAERFIEQFI